MGKNEEQTWLSEPLCCLIHGLGFRVEGLGFKVSEFCTENTKKAVSEFYRLGFRVLGFRVKGLGGEGS